MSHTTVYKIDKDGDVINHSDIKNVNLISVLIWRIMFDLYNDYFINDIERPEWMPDDWILSFSDLQIAGDMKPFFNLFSNEDVLLEHRIVFASTFDRVIIMKENFPKLINAYEKFIKQMTDEAFNEFFGDFDFSALRNFVTIIKKLQDDDDCIGITTCISLIASFWDVYDEGGKYTPYNIFKHNNHYKLFDYFKKDNNEERINSNHI